MRSPDAGESRPGARVSASFAGCAHGCFPVGFSSPRVFLCALGAGRCWKNSITSLGFIARGKDQDDSDRRAVSLPPLS
jgi:hypothetical protein